MNVLKYTLLLIAFIPLLYFRDFTPNNELRYLSIADEAIQKKHYFTFTDHGKPYADKPPLYFWLIMAGKTLFGKNIMLFIGLFSLIPALLILYIMDQWTGTVLQPTSRLNSQLMLISSGLFTGSAIVLRMDMLMCFFIVLSLFTFYKQFQKKGKIRNKISLPLFIFLALFSKGPVGLLVPLLSITVFLVLQKKIRYFGQYLGWVQWSVFLSLCGIWLACVYLEGGKEYLKNLLFHQTLDRAVQAFHHQEPVYYYFLTIWYALAPWSLFYIITIITAICKKAIQTPLEKFFLTIILVSITMLSAFSGKLAIYLLPTFPFLTYLSIMLWPKLNKKALNFTIAIPAILLLFSLPALIIFTLRSKIELSLLSGIALFILSASAALSLYFLYKRTGYKAINCIACGILCAIFTGSFTLPKLNEYIGLAAICQEAQTLAHKNNIRNFYYYKFRSGEYLDIYLGNDTTPLRTDNLEDLDYQQNFILFLRNKDIAKSEQLQQFLTNKIPYKVGNHCFVVFPQ